MIIQYIIIASILLLCTGYLLIRLYHTLTDSRSACKGCQLKDACNRHAHANKAHRDECLKEQA